MAEATWDMSAHPIDVGQGGKFFGDDLSPRDFLRLSAFLHERTGIYMNASKKILLEGRVRKRMRRLGIESSHAYCDYVLSPEGEAQELEFFINSATTNKTDFMREFHHFEFVRNEIIPYLLKKRKKLTFWSAACSRGAEPYTLAMVLEDYRQRHPRSGLEYQIDASDISTDVLKHALSAVYTEEEVAPIPVEWRKLYLLRSRSAHSDRVRIHPDLRSKVEFTHLNLMDAFPWEYAHDVIFCRNVTIYFDYPTRMHLAQRLLDALSPDGYLIMGHSETLDTSKLHVVACGPSIYQKK